MSTDTDKNLEIHVVTNLKGGVGKTAIATVLVKFFAHQGDKVLVIDTTELGHLIHNFTEKSKDFIIDTVTEYSPNIDLLAVPVSFKLERQKMMYHFLERFVNDDELRYDKIVIDGYPTEGCVPILGRCDYCYIPVNALEPDDFSYRAWESMCSFFGRMQEIPSNFFKVTINLMQGHEQNAAFDIPFCKYGDIPIKYAKKIVDMVRKEKQVREIWKDTRLESKIVSALGMEGCGARVFPCDDGSLLVLGIDDKTISLIAERLENGASIDARVIER